MPPDSSTLIPVALPSARAAPPTPTLPHMMPPSAAPAPTASAAKPPQVTAFPAPLAREPVEMIALTASPTPSRLDMVPVLLALGVPAAKLAQETASPAQLDQGSWELPQEWSEPSALPAPGTPSQLEAMEAAEPALGVPAAMPTQDPV